MMECADLICSDINDMDADTDMVDICYYMLIYQQLGFGIGWISIWFMKSYTIV